MGAGQPRKINSVEEMQEKIDKYFAECEGDILKDGEGTIILNKYDSPIYINSKPLTITGLALALGFNSRQSLLNYSAINEEYLDAITRAKSVIEEYTERRLFDKEGSNGAKFSLINNYKGWKEKQEVESINHNYNQDITALSDADIDAEIEKYN